MCPCIPTPAERISNTFNIPHEMLDRKSLKCLLCLERAKMMTEQPSRNHAQSSSGNPRASLTSLITPQFSLDMSGETSMNSFDVPCTPQPGLRIKGEQKEGGCKPHFPPRL